MAGRTYKTEAVVLRSIRFGGRLEPLSHVELMLHQGSGELQTVTGVHLVRPHSEAREDYYRLSIGLIGAEAMLRLFSEQEPNARAFTALTRFLDLLDDAPHVTERPALDPLALSFQLKLLWLSGYLPHLTSCAECGAIDAALVGYSPSAGGAVCKACAVQALALSTAGIHSIETLLTSPLADAGAAGLNERSARDALRLVQASYEYHGGFRLRTLSA
jgi:DNA repair protein RecO (recombination protein O)